jgi:hypothetical protein
VPTLGSSCGNREMETGTARAKRSKWVPRAPILMLDNKKSNLRCQKCTDVRRNPDSIWIVSAGNNKAMMRALAATRILLVTAGVVCTPIGALAVGSSDQFELPSARHSPGNINRGQWNTWGVGRGSKGDRLPAPSTKPTHDGQSLTR